jgi:hypothetical protein
MSYMRWHSGLDFHGSGGKARPTLAVATTTIEITMPQAAAMNARRRVTGDLGAPADALAWMRQHNAARRAERAS